MALYPSPLFLGWETGFAAMEYDDSALPGGRLTLLSDYVRKSVIAREFEVSERTIERWVRLRLLPAPLKLGRTSFFHLPTVADYLANQIKPNGLRRRR